MVKFYYFQKEATERRNGGFVYCEEFAENSKDRHYYVFKTQKRYAEYFFFENRRRTHELILKNTRIKMFVDFDSKENLDLVWFNGIVKSVIAKINGGEYIQFDASRAEKLSRHVIFPNFIFNKVEDVKAYLLTLKLTREERRVMDMGLYTPGRTLRTPYSTGIDRNVPLLPYETSGTEMELFLKGLLHMDDGQGLVMDEEEEIMVDDAINETTMDDEGNIRRWAETNGYTVRSYSQRELHM